MIAIKPFAEIMDIGNETDVLKKIETVARTCYKSTENIKEGSAEKFVEGLIKRGHEAMLEHASFCFEVDYGVYRYMKDIIQNLSDEFEYKSFMRFTLGERVLMSGNVRAWRDLFRNLNEQFEIPDCFKGFINRYPVLFGEWKNVRYNAFDIGSIRLVHTKDPWENLLDEHEIMTHCDVTVRFVVDRGISHELVRHRPASFAQESTRYCNYSKDKFGNQIAFIIPEGFTYGSSEWKIWEDAMDCAEGYYMWLIDAGTTPEWARTVLPNSVKTEVIMTANCAEWVHFFNLRACNTTGKAHPQMLEVSRPLLDDFKKSIEGVFDGLTYGE